jgi:hypothetical protein
LRKAGVRFSRLDGAIAGTQAMDERAAIDRLDGIIIRDCRPHFHGRKVVFRFMRPSGNSQG